ncbi:MAG: class I SAM-dependent methyltransferase [Methylococcales bacterium]|nr:class I SAM-dependent methyltransferase [Methylococcales bacterium]
MSSFVRKLKEKMQHKWRKKRISSFIEKMNPDKNTRILDLGGTPFFWDVVDADLNIVIFNTEDEVRRWPINALENYNVIAGDALHYQFDLLEFDIVFSNSVIEHIPQERVPKFAQIVKDIAPRYWIQTPSKYFPIEAHCNLLFWWFYPSRVKTWWINKWYKSGNAFLADQMQTTHTYGRKQIVHLFPEASVVNERVLGIIKSYSVWK